MASQIVWASDRSVGRASSVPGRQAGHARAAHLLFGADLVAHQAHDGGGWACQRAAGLFHRFGEISIFGQETVAGMDDVGVREFGGAQDTGGVQIAAGCCCRADAERFVHEAQMREAGIGFGMDADAVQAEQAAGARDAQGDLTAIGDQDAAGFGYPGLRHQAAPR